MVEKSDPNQTAPANRASIVLTKDLKGPSQVARARGKPFILPRASRAMNEQRRVETVEEFKMRIAAIITGKPEQITGAPRPHPRLVRSKKRATHRKIKRRATR